MSKKEWSLIFDPKCLKQFKKLDRPIQKRISQYIDERVLPDPYNLAEPLSEDKVGLHRYRIGNYRLICKIIDSELTILLLKAGPRGSVYKAH